MAGLLGSPIASAYILRPSIAEMAILDTAENLWSVFEIIVKVCLYPYVDLYIVKQMSASKSIVCLLDPLIDLLPAPSKLVLRSEGFRSVWLYSEVDPWTVCEVF